MHARRMKIKKQNRIRKLLESKWIDEWTTFVSRFLKLNRNDRETKLFSKHKTVDRVERDKGTREGGSTTRGWNFHLEAGYLIYPGRGCERRINKRVNEGSATTVNERLDRASIEFRFCYNASRSG